ncbi:MAG TPA: PfkB family carbohydrate kinase, partial [Chloroflexota bacterium]
HAIEMARHSQVRIVLNPSPARPLEPSFLDGVDIIVANRDEIATLTGLGSPVDPAISARMLIDAGAKAVIVTLGMDGAVAVTRNEETFTPAFLVDSIDSTGAGDAFVGNLAVALVRGLDLAGAIRFATAGAALSVTRPGAQPSMPSGTETEEFLRDGSDV